MKKTIFGLALAVGIVLTNHSAVVAQIASPSSTLRPTSTPVATIIPTPLPTPAVQEPAADSLEAVLYSKDLGEPNLFNAFDYAIRGAVEAGVPANTIVLLLLLPLVAAIIAAARHLVGLRGFGIFLPAALSVVFLAIGPVVGLGLFLIIVITSVLIRTTLRALKLRLQYLPRMALLLWFVSVGVLLLLFATPFVAESGLSSVSIFPVLILVLLAEDFTKVQMGKSAKTAINLTTETLILALVSFIFLTFEPLQEFALLNPEILLLGVFVFDFVVGKYVGLRFMEYWRFRKLLSS